MTGFGPSLGATIGGGLGLAAGRPAPRSSGKLLVSEGGRRFLHGVLTGTGGVITRRPCRSSRRRSATRLRLETPPCSSGSRTQYLTTGSQYVETIRFSPIGQEDINFGPTGKFESR